MKDALGPANRRRLWEVARKRVLFAFDFDGTLAPIVSDPARARMRRRTERLLRELAVLGPCIVISGRARRDVRQRLEGVPLRQVIGNHGVEPWESSERWAKAVRRWRPRLERRLSPLPGITVEDKGLSLAIHYRRSRRPELARRLIASELDDIGERIRIVGGKRVVNVLPAAAPNKGMALLHQIRLFGCQSALYVGDDDTDEDVFALGLSSGILTVRVGRKSSSAAQYFVTNQRAVDDLLAMLVRARRSTASRASARRSGSGRRPSARA